MARKRRVIELSNQLPKQIVPKTRNQAMLIDVINKNLVTFVIGGAGTGKTFTSIGCAVEHFYNGYVKKLILTRPAVEMGPTMGHLPGDTKDKLLPFLTPIYDELSYFCPKEILQRIDIDIVPLNFMRGRTFKDSFIVLDEAQNCTYHDLVTVLSRFGEGSKMVITADPLQSDLPKHKQGGILDIVSKLTDLDLVGIVHLERTDIVRHELVGRMLDRLKPEDY